MIGIWRLAMVGALVASVATSALAVPVARAGRAACVILVRPDAIESEKYAADELAHWLGKITGAQFQVTAATQAPSGPVIYVGGGSAASGAFPDAPLDALGDEEVLIQTRGVALLLAGGRPRGTLYAVYRFLSGNLGIRWWAPWATDVPSRRTLQVGPISLREKPAFESRDPFWFPAFNGDWAARNGSNSEHAHLEARHGGKILYKGFVHTFFPLVPPEKHFASHPEWYSLINGKRTYDGAQLCTTNPELRDFLVEQVRAWLKESPDARIVSISQNDCFGPCECPNCSAIDKAEGANSGTMVALLNYIAGKLGPEFPNVAFDTLAYQYTRKAPATIKPLPSVIVRLCSIECNFAAPLTDPSNAKFADDIRAWNRVCNRLYIWDYTTNFGHYMLPHPNYYSLGPNVRFFAANGVKGLFEQGAYQSFSSEMSEMRAWVLAQLLWNPALDDRKLIREFCEGYYGKSAGRIIVQYLQLMQSRVKGQYLSCFANTGGPHLRFATLGPAERLWQAAEAAASGDPEKLWRVRQGHLAVQYAYLVRWTALRAECLRAGGTWPMDLSRKKVAQAWLATATGPGPDSWGPVTHINEGGATPAAFVARMAQDPAEPTATPLPRRRARADLPSDIPGSARSTWIDIQDSKARLWNEPDGSEIRGDTAASDGVAAWISGNHHEWAFQIPFEALPERAKSGSWKVYIVARVDADPSESSTNPALTAGIYDTAGTVARAQLSLTVGQVSGGYKSFLLGTVEASKFLYIWAAPTGNPGVRSVWIDRVVLVPAGEPTP